ncbi:hypothetical protein PIB30_003100 [Stylosanthes scabra]|uniref:F-box associated beta-propeller type 1 domain-containing protein n=1 Tax=Stylosanthes scabra TaxID=79078 RepID=A0ABU6Y1D6_9FABA|nr:hypothetical protein [Stylosanthes scabra]
MRIVDHNRVENKPARGLQLTARTLPMEELPEEMIMEILVRLPVRMEILVRLPVRTLSSMKSVCRVLSVQSLLDSNPSEPAKVAHFRGQSSYQIVGSCHGLICLFDHDFSCAFMRAVLWNPYIGFTFQSPQISCHVHLCGFGYDHLSDSYKICGITRKPGPSGFENSARIYTFASNSSWRTIDDIPTDEDLSMADKGVYFGSSSACTLNWSHNHVVYYFDLSKEAYGYFALPHHRDLDHYDPRRKVCTTLCVLRNCLCVCYGSQTSQHWSLWLMKEYGDAQSWTKLAVNPYYCRHPLKPLYISESNVLLLIIYPLFKVVTYNLNYGRLGFTVIDHQFPHSVENVTYEEAGEKVATHCKNVADGRAFRRDNNGNLSEASGKDSLLLEEHVQFMENPNGTTYYADPDDIYDGIGILSPQSMLDNPSEPTKVTHFRAQSSYRMVDSCHGLLCLFDYNCSCALMCAVLWNSCTGFTFQSPRIKGHALFCGFGYDHLSDSYKIDDIPIDENPDMADNQNGMNEYGDAQSWTKFAKFGFYADCLKPLYISESEVLYLIYPGFRVVLYNLNDGTLKFAKIDKQVPDVVGKLARGGNKIFYHESLASPNGLQSNSSKMLLRLINPKL